MDELEQIVVKSHNLFMKYGIKSVSMDDIARELGMSKKTIYQYVKDKNELVNKMFEFEKGCMQEKFELLQSEQINAIDQIFEADKMFVSIMKEHNPAAFYDLRKYYPTVHTKMVAVRRSRITEFMMQNIEKGKIEGLFRKELDASIMAKLYILRIEGIMDGDILTLQEFTSPKWIKEHMAYHVRGISTPKGIEYFEQKLVDFNIEL